MTTNALLNLQAWARTYSHESSHKALSWGDRASWALEQMWTDLRQLIPRKQNNRKL